MTVSRSNRTPSSVSTSVQKRHPLYISSTDPRNNAKYILSYPGEVVVLSPTDYIKYINNSSPIPLVNGEVTGATVANLHPPTNLYWDTSAIANDISSTGSGSLLDIIITFDPSTDDISTDGSITYEAVFTLSNQSTVQNNAATGATNITNAANQTLPSTSVLTPVGTVTTVHAGTDYIELEWKGLSNIVDYEVTVTGNNLPGSAGQKKKTYSSLPGNNSKGYHFYTLRPTSGSLSGSYSFSIAAKYSNGISKAVVYNVTA